MNKQLLFIQGAGPMGPRLGSGYLLTSLRRELEDEYEIIAPTMPNPLKPSYGGWQRQLEASLQELRGPTVVVGHSLGGSLLLKYCSENGLKDKIAGICSVAAPFWGADKKWQFKEFTLPQDPGSRLDDIPGIFLYHSRNDRIVPFSHLAHYTQAVPQATVRDLEGYGHVFRTAPPSLIADIRSLSK